MTVSSVHCHGDVERKPSHQQFVGMNRVRAQKESPHFWSAGETHRPSVPYLAKYTKQPQTHAVRLLLQLHIVIVYLKITVFITSLLISQPFHYGQVQTGICDILAFFNS